MSKVSSKLARSLLNELTEIGLKALKSARTTEGRRKTQSLLFKGNFLGIDFQFKIPRKTVPVVLERIDRWEAANTISPGDQLFFGLRDFLQRELHRDMEIKARGRQASRSSLVSVVKWAAPWVFCFVQEICQKREFYPKRALTVDAEVRSKIGGKLSARRHAIYLTAALVSKAYPDWYRLDLMDPLSDPEDFEPEHFYRVFISPHLQHVRDIIAAKPKMLVPTHNAYLRKVFGF